MPRRTVECSMPDGPANRVPISPRGPRGTAPRTRPSLSPLSALSSLALKASPAGEMAKPDAEPGFYSSVGPSPSLERLGAMDSASASPRRSVALCNALQEACRLAETVAGYSGAEEELLHQLCRLMGHTAVKDSKGSTPAPPPRGDVGPGSPRTSIKELKHITSSPFLFRKLCRASATTELLMAFAFDVFANAKSVEKLQQKVAAVLPALLSADSCGLLLKKTTHMVDLETGAKRPIAGLVGQAACSMVPIHILRPREHTDFDAAIDAPNAQCYLCKPVMAQGQVIAVLRVIRRSESAVLFSEAELEFVDGLLDIITMSMRFSLANQTIKHQEARTTAMLEMAQSLAASEGDYNKVCSALLEHSRRLCSADRASMFVINREKGELEAHFGTGEVVRMPIDSGIAGKVAMTGKTVNIQDAYKDPDFNPAVDVSTGYRTKSMLCLPIWHENPAGDEIVAVAQLINKLEDGQVSEFTQADVTTFNAFSGYAAASLRNAQLHRTSQLSLQQAQALLGAAHALATESLDEDRLVQKVMDAARRITDSDRCALFLLDRNDEQLIAHFEDGHSVKMPMNAGIAGHVATTGEVVKIADAYEDPRFNADVDKSTGYRTQSMLCMPVTFDSQIVAVAQLINKMSPKGGVIEYAMEDVDLFQSFAVNAAVFLRTARLHKEALRQREMAETSSDLVHTLSRSVLCDADELTQILIQEVVALSGARHCGVFLMNNATATLGPSVGNLPPLPQCDEVARAVADAKLPFLLPDASQDVRFANADEVESLLCFPIISDQDRVLGVMQVINSEGEDGATIAFNDQDVDRVELLCHHAGLALQTSHLYHYARTQATKSNSLLTLAQHLSNAIMDERKLITTVMEQAKELTASDRCSLFLVHPRQFELEAHFGDDLVVRMPLTSGIAGAVASSGETVRIDDAYADSRFNKLIDLQTGYVTKSILCMPVSYEGSVVAVAQVVNKIGPEGPAPYTDEDIELFKPFAEFAGIALRQCRIWTQLLAQRRKDVLYQRVLENLTSTSINDGDQVCHVVCRGACDYLESEWCTFYAVDPANYEIHVLSTSYRERDHEPLEGGEAPTAPAKSEDARQGLWAVAEEVVRTGKAENISCAGPDGGVLQSVLGEVWSCLSVPVRLEGKLAAVMQVVNKDGNKAFTEADQELLTSLSMFAGIALSNMRLYNFVLDANRQATELLKRRQGEEVSDCTRMAPLDDALVQRVLQLKLDDATKRQAATLDFSVFEHQDGPADSDAQLTLVNILVFFFEDLGLVEGLGVDREVLTRFVVRARSLYRRVAYHNFFHAFDVTHMVYYILKCLGPVVHFDAVEKLALMTAAVVHDVDHMGLNNSFHLKCDTPMGILSSSAGIDSVLEIHHCNLAIELLSLPHHNVFGCLDDPDRTRAYKLLVDIILATDMARHGVLTREFAAATESLKAGDSPPKLLTLKMIMKSADLSNIVRPFHLSQRWAASITEEFYAQGDQERERGFEVAALFDRTRDTQLAKGQLDFIKFVGMGHFTTMGGWTQALHWMRENLSSNVKAWEALLVA